MRISTILVGYLLFLSNYSAAQIDVEIISSGLCTHLGNYTLTDNGILGGKNSYSNGLSTATTLQWSTTTIRWELRRGSSLIAFNVTDTDSDPPCLSAGGWQGSGGCDVGQLDGPDCDNLECALIITQNTQSTCIKNGTLYYFTLTVNASETNGGSDYQVLVGGSQLGSDTPNNTTITLGNGTNGAIGTFVADGSTTYTVTVRDAITQTCVAIYTTTPVVACLPADYVMGQESGILNVCSGVFSDSGDLIADYSDNDVDTLTFCSQEGNQISISFTLGNNKFVIN